MNQVKECPSCGEPIHSGKNPFHCSNQQHIVRDLAYQAFTGRKDHVMSQEHNVNGHLVEVYKGYEIRFSVSSYNCAALKLFGYAYDTSLKSAITKAIKKAESKQKAVKS